MEEANTNVHIEVNEMHHHDINPNQGICKEVKNVACTTEEITENPEYVVMRRTTAVGSVTNEEVVIPKQSPALNFRPIITVASSEIGSNTTEMDISSQESAMDIASQESLPIQDLRSEESCYCNHRVSVVFREEAVLAREEVVQKREEAVLAKEEDVRKRERAVLNSEEKLTNLKEKVANREKILIQLEKDIKKQQESLNIQTKLIEDRELTLRKRESAIQIRELQADRCKFVLPSSKSNGNGCLPAKRSKKI